MGKAKFRALIYPVLLAAFLAVAAGCGDVSDDSHNYGVLHGAVPAGFFRDGCIAYYQCANCEKLFDSQMTEIETAVIPRFSTEVSLCVNGEPTPLVPGERDAGHITWSLENLCVEAGDVITLRDSAGGETVYAYTPEGNVDEAGRIKTSAPQAAVSLTATPDGLTLFVSGEKYLGVVAEINGTQYPMHLSEQGGTVVYTYGYAVLKAGDRLAVTDNVSGVTYGYEDLSEACAWNLYDYHRGENGDFVIDCEGRYLLEFGDEKISVTKVSAPMEGDGFQVVFGGENGERVPMKEVTLAPDSELLGTLVRYAASEDTMNGGDIADFLAQKPLRAYSAVLFLEAGTKFRVENGTGSERAAGDRLTEVSGGTGCLRRNGDYVETVQAGTYFIRFLPASGSISVEQLTTGGLKEAAKLFDKEITAIPSYLEIYYADEIKRLYEEYRSLPESFQSRLQASAKLELLYTRAVESTSAQVIYYLNTDSTNHVYRSREELFSAFFTDFYYYIAAYHGTGDLERQGIRNAGDFVALAKDFNGAGMSNLYGIGFLAKEHLLESRKNGVLEEQTDNGFFGFCCQNDLYQEILPFFIRFFAYWRLDEHYANSSNPGADIFAEAWAPTVDIAKFFYYNEETSYVKSERVLDCFTNTAGVVYWADGTDPLPDISLRGYLFEGWYDNPEFTGSPVTSLDPGEKTVRLYAKWSPDMEQRDRDSAALVDVYIYNLTTQKARRNENTVGNVKEMYDSLTPNAKQLVQEYRTLQDLVGQFCESE